MRLSRLLLLVVLALPAAACSRKVVVTTPSTRSDVSLKVTNTANQGVTVMVVTGADTLTVGTVAANTTAVLTVPNVPSGATVQLRATLADGSRTFSRDGVVLSGTFDWRVP